VVVGDGFAEGDAGVVTVKDGEFVWGWRRAVSFERILAEAVEDSPLIAMLLDDYYQRTLQAPLQAPTGEAEEPVEEAPEPAGERMEITGGDQGMKRKRPRKRGPRRRES